MNEVLGKIDEAKREASEKVGIYVISEAQMRTPVGTDPSDKHKGNLRRSETFEVMENNEGVRVGVTPSADYGKIVELGSSKMKAQPFLTPAVEENISTIEAIVDKIFAEKLGK